LHFIIHHHALHIVSFVVLSITALRISGDPLKIYFHKDCPLQPLDGRRAAAASKWMEIRRADGAGAKRLLHRFAQQPKKLRGFCGIIAKRHKRCVTF